MKHMSDDTMAKENSLPFASSAARSVSAPIDRGILNKPSSNGDMHDLPNRLGLFLFGVFAVKG